MNHQADVLIYLPYALEDAAGNSVTALRLRRQLMTAGLQVVIVTPRDSLVPARCLIALNAWRSAEIISRFHGKMIVLLTGTDINDERICDRDWEGRIAMEKADELVVLQEDALKRVPENLQHKSRAILPSVELPADLSHMGNSSETIRVVLAGRHRVEKQPDLLLDACRLMPTGNDLQIEWFGATSDETAPYFQWKGSIPQEELWREMARADYFLNTSSEEGGANAVCEAIALGLPVLASRIGGNIGLLGDDYLGYFQWDDPADLARLLQQLPRPELKAQVEKRQQQFQYEREERDWIALVQKLLSS